VSPSPYAPPRAPIGAYGTLPIKRTEPLPLVCLKCGVTHPVAHTKKSLIVLGRARLVTLTVALVGGVVIAAVPTPQTRMLFFVGLAVIAFLLRRFVNPRVEMSVPLCASCAHRWAMGLRWSKVLRGVIFACSVVATVLMLLAASPLLVVLFALGIFGAMIGILLLRMRSRIVVAKEMKGDDITLALVHQDAVAAVNALGREGPATNLVVK
jgi:hypothetical protein